MFGISIVMFFSFLGAAIYAVIRQDWEHFPMFFVGMCCAVILFASARFSETVTVLGCFWPCG
jgi:hypothetical protein